LNAPRVSDLLVLALCGTAFSLGPHRPYSKDVTGAEYTALAIASGRGTSLNDYPELTAGDLPYFVTSTPEGVRSSYPLGPALVAWPVYLTAPLFTLQRSELVSHLGAAAALLLALAAVWLALTIAKRLEPPFSPHVLALAYGLGTTHWSTSASALWQHGPGEVWVLGAIERLLDSNASFARRLLAAGACLSLAVFTRPPHAISVAILVALALGRYRLRTMWVVVGAALVGGPLLHYNLGTYGSVVGPYAAQTTYLSLKPVDVWLGTVAAQVLSPSRGVLWYEPVVFFGLLAGAVVLVRRRSTRLLAASVLGAFAFLGFYGHWSVWWGGLSFGPRLLTDMLPWWVLACASLRTGSLWLEPALVAFAVWGAVVNWVGATSSWVRWDASPPVQHFTDRLVTPGDSQLLLGALDVYPVTTITHEALAAEDSGRNADALALWKEEWRRRPWHRYPAFRIADLELRLDRLDEARAHVEDLERRWPGSSYVQHLSLRLPDVFRFLDGLPPQAARAGEEPERARFVLDSRLGTAWSTGRPQRAQDWLELDLDPAVPVRGMVLISVPDFGAGPSGLDVLGTLASGEARPLATLASLEAGQKGWVALRFDPVNLTTLRLTVRGRGEEPWVVSEARLLTAR